MARAPGYPTSPRVEGGWKKEASEMAKSLPLSFSFSFSPSRSRLWVQEATETEKARETLRRDLYEYGGLGSAGRLERRV